MDLNSSVIAPACLSPLNYYSGTGLLRSLGINKYWNLSCSRTSMESRLRGYSSLGHSTSREQVSAATNIRDVASEAQEYTLAYSWYSFYKLTSGSLGLSYLERRLRADRRSARSHRVRDTRTLTRHGFPEPALRHTQLSKEWLNVVLVLIGEPSVGSCLLSQDVCPWRRSRLKLCLVPPRLAHTYAPTRVSTTLNRGNGRRTTSQTGRLFGMLMFTHCLFGIGPCWTNVSSQVYDPT